MKTLSTLAFCLMMALSGCKTEDTAVTPPVTPAYQTAIDAKYKSLGWDTDGHVPDNNATAIKTKGGKGWVQYYTLSKVKEAIYYFEGKGAFAMNVFEKDKYDALGQDTFAYLTSDPKSCGLLCTYNEISLIQDSSNGIIITALNEPGTGGKTSTVYGEIYKKYNAIDRWNSLLGYPAGDEGTLTTRKEGRFQQFTKSNGGGQIYWSAATGAQAFWGKVEKMYSLAGIGFDGSWLGLPVTSCDPAKNEILQVVQFEKGTITGLATCGSYQNQQKIDVDKNGSTTTNHGCY